jgi:hypothetical protein
MTHTMPAHHHGKVWRAFCFHRELTFATAPARRAGAGSNPRTHPCTPAPPGFVVLSLNIRATWTNGERKK